MDKYIQKILDDFDQSEKIIKLVRIKASDNMKNFMVKRNYLNKDIIDRISIEKIKDIFCFI